MLFLISLCVLLWRSTCLIVWAKSFGAFSFRGSILLVSVQLNIVIVGALLML